MQGQPANAAPVHRAAMVEAFSHLLGNTFCLQRVALSCEWNVRGPFAEAASVLFHRQAEEMFRALSAIAACVRTTGQSVRADESDLVLDEAAQDAAMADPEVRTLLRVLSLGHENTIISIQAASDIATEIGDRRSLHVLDTRLVAHEGHLAQIATFRR
jgi:DNA-binding ferritin-like protein